MVSRFKIIEDLKNQPETAIAYHYCDFMDASSTSPPRILRTLFAQLLPVNCDLAKDFSDIISQKDKPEPPPGGLPELCELRRASKYHRQVAIIVDALDKCNDNREDLFSSLRGLSEAQGFAVFLTSRKEHDVTEAFLNKPCISLNSVRDRIEADMKAYINDEPQQKRPRLARLGDDLKAKMVITLVEKADGM